MKLIFFLTLSLFFFSCDSIIDSNNNVISTGIIHKTGLTSYQYGTQTLNDSNGKLLYALISSTIDLDNYENKDVIISGNFVKGYPVDGGPKYLNVTIVSLLK